MRIWHTDDTEGYKMTTDRDNNPLSVKIGDSSVSSVCKDFGTQKSTERDKITTDRNHIYLSVKISALSVSSVRYFLNS